MAVIDLGLAKEIRSYGTTDFSACYSCGNCTAICELSEENAFFPRNLIRYGMLGMKDKILSSKELWLCYGCGECSQTCPREAEPGDFVAALRRYAIAHYEPTGLTRLMFRRPFAFVGITLLVALLLFVILMTLSPDHEVSRWIFNLLPFDVVHDLGMWLFVVVGIVAVFGLYRMVRALGKGRQGVSAAKSVSLEVAENEIVGLVGESGSGKTISTQAITRILPGNARIISGEAIFEASDLIKMRERQLEAVRGSKIAYIFQEPTMFLNPLLSVGFQISESVGIYKSKDGLGVMMGALELLRRVGLPEGVFYDYPHQLSGGMNQRIMIAQALALNPKLLIADEPTTSLDADTETEILELILNLQKEIGFSCLFITHNLGLIKRLCQRVYVMYKGSIVEQGGLEEMFSNPKHAHTQALVRAYLRLGRKAEGSERG